MGREREPQKPQQQQPPQQQQQQVSYTVDQLVAINPYNPDILSELENNVNEQVSSQTYSLDANLCLLRFYQFEPERMSTQIVARILVKALMAMPAPDFGLCLFLIPERVQMEEQFKTLIVLSHYLEVCLCLCNFSCSNVWSERSFTYLFHLQTGRFRQFWDEAAKSRHIVEAVPGFEQAIQSYAIHLLSLTYQKVPRSVLAEAINVEGLSLDKFLEHLVANSGWILEKGHGKGQLIVLPRKEFNHPELKKNTADGIPLEHITRIFPILG
ncbi:Eukaryotic translation initiation factor 3 subunit K [Turnera subulata]|uniref:Eukaryotic translation initiation factor 3 subunit K n=1 Tax=Turnera subulata TaxID=218843 RepID=A0A9Q0F6G5_9ROSI|nr:Eukaryotic translation initiation factor 3 subunit K [Turnera subulata]